MFNKSSKSSPPTQPTQDTMSSTTPMTPRHAALESSFPAAFFGKKKSITPTTTSMETTAESDRRMSVSSTATTATASSVSSEATTIDAAPSISEKHMFQKQEAQAQPFDPFDYQSAGYLSMPLNHKDQPYLQPAPNSSSASSSRKSSSSSSSSSKSLWQKTKNLTQRRSSEDREKAKKEYEELGLEEKTKFGMGEGGMRMVG